jgi:hypothetical protein
MNVKLIHGLFVVVACVAALPAIAEDTVLVPALIPYQSADTAGEEVRRECKWNTTMPLYLVKESKGWVKVTDQSFDTVTPKKLMLVATHLHTVGGGQFTGPKWLVLEGKLTEGDKLLGNFEARRQTIRGSFKGCSTLESLSEEIADDILQWLKAPRLNAKLGNAG